MGHTPESKVEAIFLFLLACLLIPIGWLFGQWYRIRTWWHCRHINRVILTKGNIMAPFFTVHHDHTYRAKLKLSWLESFASNDMIVEKFQELGFKNVVIVGDGEHRWATGVWNGPDESVPLTDEHVESVQEVHPIVAFGDFKDEKEKEEWDKLHEDGG